MSKPVDTGDAIRVVDPAQVKSWVSARASVVAPEVSFLIDGPAVKKWRRVVVRGVLENAGPAAVSIMIFSAHGVSLRFSG